MHLLFLNGPPRCGKDTAGMILGEHHGHLATMKFSAPLKRATHGLFAGLHMMLPDTPWVDEPSFFEAEKDDPVDIFFELTPRDAYISTSELLCKTLFGGSFFGELMVQRLQRMAKPPQIVAFTDCGFDEEVKPVIDWAGKINCTLIKIARDGCDFDSDSRGYLKQSMFGEYHTVINTTRSEFRQQLLAVLEMV
tara:strand:+ start:3937 stop:4515 length:579 start_codon:yes stop_codon:yes gene_type:complete